MLRTVDTLGVFWLPGQEDNALVGRLLFDPQADGIRLFIVGEFENTVDTDSDGLFRIFGLLESDEVTLDRCYVIRETAPTRGVETSSYYVNQMFFGYHFEDGDLIFQTAVASMSKLDSWVDRRGINTKSRNRSGAGSESFYSITYDPPPSESAKFSRGQVLLEYHAKTSGDSIRDSKIEQWPVIKIEYDELQPFKTIQKDLGRVQDLLTLCLDTPSIREYTILRRSDIVAKNISGEATGYPQDVEHLAVQLRRFDSGTRERHQEYMMLLNYDELGGIAAIARWLDTCPKFGRALSSFMSVDHTDRIFAENRFLNVTFAAESFHRTIKNDPPHMAETVFSELKRKYLDSTPIEYHEWLEGKIRNSPTLRKRLQELARDSQSVTRELIDNKSRWAHIISSLRDELSHLANNSRNFKGADLYFLAESVYSVVRVCMLLECGVPQETLATKAGSSTMTWYKDRLERAIQAVRDQLKN